MKYRILSPRLGTPGEIYNPAVWVNTDHLVKNGFIEPVQTDTAPTVQEPAKTKTSKKPKE